MKNKNNFDFTGYRYSVLKRRINKRLSVTNTNSFKEYYKFLIKNSSEIDALIDTLTINVSRFFRNPLVFDFISEKLIPPMIFEKIQTDEKYLRIWSAGCACGEEPYSLVIIFNEFLEKESIDLILMDISLPKMDGLTVVKFLKGEEILLEARIIGIADVIEAMSSHRPYRPALGIDAALEEISKNKGILYDPKAVDTCLVLFREKGFKFE